MKLTDSWVKHVTISKESVKWLPKYVSLEYVRTNRNQVLCRKRHPVDIIGWPSEIVNIYRAQKYRKLQHYSKTSSDQSIGMSRNPQTTIGSTEVKNNDKSNQPSDEQW